MKALLNLRSICIFIAFIALVFFICEAANARAGGGASVGRASPAPSMSRSTPSYSAPAAPRYSAPAVPQVNRSTTIINNGGGGGGSGAGGAFVGGMAGAMVGNALTNHPAPVMAAPNYGYAAPPAAPAYSNGDGPAVSYVAPVVYRGATDWTPLWLFLGFVLVAGTAYFFYLRWSRREESDAMNFDPLEFFYKLQQATMDDDKTALRNLCTPGMVMALTGSPEPGRNAVKSLTGVVWSDIAHDCVEYRFTDVVDGGKRVLEHWQFDDDKLAGIQVL